MPFVEKYIPTRINLDDSPNTTDRGGNRKFLPGDLLDALNCRIDSGEDGQAGGADNVKGNTLKLLTLPAGTNTCIGWFSHNKDNSIVYFIHNSSGEHRVYQYQPDTNTFHTLLQGSTLNFSLSNYIAQGGIIDDLCFWDDGLNPTRQINIELAKQGVYTAPYTGPEISLLKKPPLKAPTFTKETDDTIKKNTISFYNWQFSYRYIYNDNMPSVIGPISKVCYGSQFPDILDTANNKIDVTVKIEEELLGLIKRVELLCRKGNNGDFSVFHKIKDPELTSYTIGFSNNVKLEVLSADVITHPYDIIPDQSGRMAIMENRIISLRKTAGFDIDESTFDFIPERATKEVFRYLFNGEFFIDKGPFFKNNSNYSVGIRFMDEYGRTSFVKKATDISFLDYLDLPKEEIGFLNYFSQTKQYLKWTIAGTPPAGMKKYQICITRDNFYETYVQTTVNVLYYVTEARADGIVFPEEYLIGNKVFLKDGSNGSFAYLYFQLPNNLPIVIDTDHIVRVMDGTRSGELKIIDIVGNFLVVEKSYVSEVEDFPTSLIIELYKIREVVDDVYYEVGPTFDITDGQFSVLEGTVDGDCHNLMVPYIHENIFSERNMSDDFSDGRVGLDGESYVMESPTRIFSQIPKNTQIQTGLAQSFEIDNDRSLFGEALSGLGNLFGAGGFDPDEADQKLKEAIDSNNERLRAVAGSLQPGYVLDYSKIDGDYGRVTVVNDNEKKTSHPTTIIFSEPYIQDSFINGSNIFKAANQYTIPVERSPITALVKANDILLAIHERETSSVYIGEGFIRQGENFILAKTEGFIGDDRELEFSYGTINPESIVNVYGHVYFWDAFKGAVVRYTKAGLYPISNNGMRHYFYQKGLEYSPYKYNVKIVTGYDYFNDELLITFPEVKSEGGEVIIEAVTWAFSTKKEEWKTRYSFIPDMYSYINNRLYTFKNGGLWEHHTNSLYNNFYGIQYERYFKFVCNPYPSRIKTYLNIHIDAHDVAKDNTGDYKVIKAYTKDKVPQESYIPAYEFEKDEHKWYAPILKDINTLPILLPENTLALRDGEDMRSATLEVLVQSDRVDRNKLHSVNVVYKEEEFSI